MTTFVQDHTEFKSSKAISFASIFQAISRFLERRAVQARQLRELKEFQNLDSHMLNDVGLKGFDCATPEEQERMLVDAIHQH